jgi:DNA-binding beta-propeller fold protein YncE
MKKLSFLLPLVFFALIGTVVMASPPGSGYHLIKKVALGAAPGGGEYFDYVTVDSAARRVYLSHGTEVKVLDADNYSVVGTISGLKRCHGVVVLPELGQGFITDGDGASVMVFDLKTLKITKQIKSAKDTDSVVYDPASKLIFTFNGDSANSTVVNPAKETVVKVIDMGGAVEQGVVDGKGLLYDNNEEKGDIAVVDTAALTIKSRWPVAPAGTPVAIAIDSEHRRIFSSGRKPQFVVMMDADNGKVIQSLPISSGVDGNVFDPETGLLFVATRAGKLHIFHEDSPDKLTEVETLDTEYGAKTMNIDPKTHNLFLSTADFGPAPAAPTKENPKSERKAINGTFHVLIYGR